jgi:hypothetical protein
VILHTSTQLLPTANGTIRGLPRGMEHVGTLRPKPRSLAMPVALVLLGAVALAGGVAASPPGGGAFAIIGFFAVLGLWFAAVSTSLPKPLFGPVPPQELLPDE